MAKINPLIKLTRWKEYYGTVIAMTAIGIFLVQPVKLWQILLLLTANLLSTAFAYMINDVEDAEDDKNCERKKLKNPVSRGEIHHKYALSASIAAAAVSLFFYYVLGLRVFVFGLFGIILGYVYSYKRIRLKSKPFVDVASHGFFLGLMYFITAILLGSKLPSLYLTVWLGISAFLASALSDLNNEIRDLKADKKAGLQNTIAKINLLLKFNKFLYVFAFVVVTNIAITILIFATYYTKIILIGLISAVMIHYSLRWNKYRVNFYKYPWQQPLMTIVGILLIFDPKIIRIPYYLITSKNYLNIVVNAVTLVKNLLF